MYHSFTPGKPWFDTEGHPIQAHGGSILYHKGLYYWYGENKEKTVGTGIWHFGVNCYSSSDLYNWKPEGIILKPVEDDPQNPLHPTRIIDRPHILFNSATNQFVLWVKFVGTDENPGDWNVQCMGIAVSDSITGPFRLIKRIRPLGMEAGDFDLFLDDRDGKAYFVFDRVHTEVVVADLTEDFLGLTGHYSSHCYRSGPPLAREAPAVFRRSGRYYVLTSGTSGYVPNPSELCHADVLHGYWSAPADPCVDDRGEDSFNSQFSSVFRHPHKKDLYIALGDRWMAASPFGFDIVRTNTALATYTWLPFRFDSDKATLSWTDEWRIEDFQDATPEPPPLDFGAITTVNQLREVIRQRYRDHRASSENA